MIECCFVSYGPNKNSKNFWTNSDEKLSIKNNQPKNTGFAKLTHIFVYPIKSCGAIRPKR